jgi:hypothetical protein
MNKVNAFIRKSFRYTKRSLRNAKKSLRYFDLPYILKDYITFKRALETSERTKGEKGASERFYISLRNIYPCINDRTPTTSFDRHYIFHTAWASRKVKEINPTLHTDISSSLYFCSIVSAFIPVNFYDYRPAQLNLSNLQSKHADLAKLPFEDNSIESISCMHTIEHVGLGRYGDPIDPNGDLKAVRELIRVTRPGGSILFVVPIGGIAEIQFNAHRIYTYDVIVDYFNALHLVEFSLIPGDESRGGIMTHAKKEDADKELYGCGCFWFRK